jgi:hypothetical protein
VSIKFSAKLSIRTRRKKSAYNKNKNEQIIHFSFKKKVTVSLPLPLCSSENYNTGKIRESLQETIHPKS